MIQLVIAETFYSLQGEGPTSGIPAVFLRLGGCNLRCFFRDHSGQGNPCDTIPVWTKGVAYECDAVITQWRECGYLDALVRGAHLIVTGGEPTLQQRALMTFLELLRDSLLSAHLYVEIETNGTQVITDSLARQLNQVNCSPKLASSGEPFHKRYNREALAQIAGGLLSGAVPSFFKFVITQEEDIYEIMECFVHPFHLRSDQVVLMPEGVSREDLERKRALVANLCKRYGFRYSDRLQVLIWGKVTGV